ncbi:hypothetical protein ACWV26_06590 [Rummeliibacillus sp. JY-2-4R]
MFNLKETKLIKAFSSGGLFVEVGNAFLKLILSFCIIFTSLAILNGNNANAKTSYIQNKDKIYTYKQKYAYDSEEDSQTLIDKYEKTKNGYLFFSTGSYKETKNGLYIADCVKKCVNPSKIISYPIKLGKTWKYNLDYDSKIIATNLTIKTKAGTFKHVIKIEIYPPSEPKKPWSYSYYAPNVGLIREEFYNAYMGPTVWIKVDLIKLKNNKKH